MREGHVHQISISPGGVPKFPIPEALVRAGGIEGDGHNDTRLHGGPDAAVCLFSLEVIEAVRAEGHPISPGSTGENLTLHGLNWAAVTPGARLEFAGGVILEITRYTTPCSTIRDSFRGLDSKRIKHDLHPGQSRVYARVIREGTVRIGEAVALRPLAPQGS